MTCKLTARQVAEMREHRREGVPQSTLAAWYDVAPNTVQHHTKNIPPPPEGWGKGYKQKLDLEKAVRMKAEGYSRKEIALRFSCAPNYITDALRRHRIRQEGMPT